LLSGVSGPCKVDSIFKGKEFRDEEEEEEVFVLLKR
jgi:hypothetical protein